MSVGFWEKLNYDLPVNSYAVLLKLVPNMNLENENTFERELSVLKGLMFFCYYYYTAF